MTCQFSKFNSFNETVLEKVKHAYLNTFCHTIPLESVRIVLGNSMKNLAYLNQMALINQTTVSKETLKTRSSTELVLKISQAE